MDFERNAHLAPSPSYALEDESDSEWDDGELSTSRSTAKELAPEPVVTLDGPVEAVKEGKEAVFLLGEAGERIAQGIELDDAAATVRVLVDGEQAGLIVPARVNAPTLVLLSAALPLATLHPLSAKLLEALKPATSISVSTYHLPSWIPASNDPSSSTAPILYLSSASPSPAVAQLRSHGAVQPFSPPNLHHGLGASLLTLSALSTSAASSTLFLLPTTTPPQPLNGPFAPLSPIVSAGVGSAGTLYDAGGPTGLSDPGALFRSLAGIGSKRAAPGAAPLRAVKDALAWDWWVPGRQGGKGFEWLERQRKERRREAASSMYM
ncbi:hypothetical protein Rhopal_001595-T1 [Rhodotorula paludigena]|uniref:Proteasome assembly chaperone 1 n=1 Tax=Rhodotorula paludigena TaxID=86838 RepID=A0AAV5GDP5_9BASI|nr:hypothetical protein Rhopal_001595-T1 [Rhodotorula paludigena]